MNIVFKKKKQHKKIWKKSPIPEKTIAKIPCLPFENLPLYIKMCFLKNVNNGPFIQFAPCLFFFLGGLFHMAHTDVLNYL